MEEQPASQKSNRAVLIIGILAIILVIGLFTNGFGILNLIFGPSGNIPLEMGNSPVLGNPNASITIYEFSDFSCLFCAAANGFNTEAINALKRINQNWEAPIQKIKENYIKEGKVKIVFKYSKGHGSGKPAHLVALAMQEQGLFWKFHEAAFANQKDTGDLAKMKELAKQLGANMTRLESSLKNNISKYEDQLKNDMAMAKSAGVKGTPTFIINGKKIEGAESFSEFKKLIDKELTNE
jgi:protein-disulfide isomerase